MRRLLGIRGVYADRSFELEKDELTLGKDASCDIRLDADDDIAGTQAKMTLAESGYELSDLDHNCPTMVNGQALDGAARLRDSDVLQVGNTVLRYEDTESKQQNAAGASPASANKTVANTQRPSANSHVTDTAVADIQRLADKYRIAVYVIYASWIISIPVCVLYLAGGEAKSATGFFGFLIVTLTIALFGLAAANDKHGHLAAKARAQAKSDTLAKMRQAADQEGFLAARYAYIDAAEALLAVNDDASQLAIVYKNTASGIEVYRLISSQILSVDVITDIREHRTMMGAMVRLGEGFSGLFLGGSTTYKLRGVWVKILIHNVQCPWIVFQMDSLEQAEDWLGIISIITRKAA